MKFFADFHIHGKYARATSKNATFDTLADGAKLKGLNLLGTGDICHPKWFEEAKKKLVYDSNGIYSYGGIYWMITVEISTMYSQDGKGRSVHHMIHLPSLECAEQLQEWLKKYGKMWQTDGRPIIGATSAELVEKVLELDHNAIVYPAHCLLPDEIVLMNLDIKEIKDIKEGDKVLTHNGDFQKVEKLFSRNYNGLALKIIPRYFTNGIKVTMEHPFLAIKSVKNCNGGRGFCKPTDVHIRNCYRHYYKHYKPQWMLAQDLEIGDILLYPRITKTEDIKEILVDDYIQRIGNFPDKIKVDEDFCKLAGYYLAEGCTNSRDGIGFAFNGDTETEYIDEVKILIKKIFNLECKNGKSRGEFVCYSKDLMNLFRLLFYKEDSLKRAFTKRMPQWMIYLPKNKQAEIFRCWWRGDKGSSTSRLLHNQMKIICLRLGIIPSTGADTVESRRIRGFNKIGERIIQAKNDTYILGNLSFFENEFGLLEDKEFRKFITKTEKRHGWIDNKYAYIPIRAIERFNYSGKVYNLEVENDHSYTTEAASVHNCFTPWFGALGNDSGFNSLEECYLDQANNIRLLETGMSTVPSDSWRISSLDSRTPISNSDPHSPHPWRLGREANVIEAKLDFTSVNKAMIDRRGLLYTIEVDPNYGKYHFSGHRTCNFVAGPTDVEKLKGICPVCKKPLTIGVTTRIEKLADRGEGYTPKNAVEFRKILPLHELLANIMGVKNMASKKVQSEYQRIIKGHKNEFHILLEEEPKELRKDIDEKIVDVIMKNREGKLRVKPGYDGVYGELVLVKKT